MEMMRTKGEDEYIEREDGEEFRVEKVRVRVFVRSTVEICLYERTF